MQQYYLEEFKDSCGHFKTVVWTYCEEIRAGHRGENAWNSDYNAAIL